jgi:hypothetical protein
LKEAEATEFKFASVEQGRALLLGEDAWFAGLGSAEIAIRMGSPVPDKTADDLRDFYSEGILAWTEQEIGSQKAVIAGQGEMLARWGHLLPGTVWFVKMSGRVEGGMPHTRGNAIFLPEPGGEASTGLFLHELFHVLSRAQASRHDALYDIVGFKPCKLEETDWMMRRRLSNPDVPRGAWYLDVEGPDVEGPDVEGRDADAVMPWLHAAHDAFDEGVHGGFGGHFGFGLLSVIVSEGKCGPRQSETGVPVILSPGDVPGFAAAIGRNTGYIIHPEEVLADNFIFLVTGRTELPNPEIPEKLRLWLDRK